jgi:hypothetical protein
VCQILVLPCIEMFWTDFLTVISAEITVWVEFFGGGPNSFHPGLALFFNFCVVKLWFLLYIVCISFVLDKEKL